jgi:hypothetical protein
VESYFVYVVYFIGTGRGSDCLHALTLNKLLKNIDARIVQDAADAASEYATGTRNFRPLSSDSALPASGFLCAALLRLF